MAKVVINRCWGGFGLSNMALDMLEQRGYEVNTREWGRYLANDIERHNEDLVEIVEILGEEADGSCARLVVVELQGDLYRIDEYDGMESVEEPHSLDWIVAR